jgi:hypothetical protein
LSASEEEVDVVVHEDPGVNGAFGVLNVLPKTLKELGFVLAIAKNILFVDSPDHDMVQSAGDI